MKLYDDEIGISIDRIDAFFKKKEFYFVMQKAGLDKSFSKKYQSCYDTFNYCLKNNLIDFKINEGHKKVIFQAKNNNDYVIKIFKTHEDYNSEKSYYDRLINYGLEKLVPRMNFQNNFSIVEKIEPVSHIVWIKFLKRFCIIPENSGPVYSNMRLFKKKSDLSVLEKIYKESITETRPDFATFNDRLVIIHLDKINWDKIDENLEELKKTDFILE